MGNLWNQISIVKTLSIFFFTKQYLYLHPRPLSLIPNWPFPFIFVEAPVLKIERWALIRGGAYSIILGLGWALSWRRRLIEALRYYTDQIYLTVKFHIIIFKFLQSCKKPNYYIKRLFSWSYSFQAWSRFDSPNFYGKKFLKKWNDYKIVYER